MPLIANAEFAFDIFKLALCIACSYLALCVYACHVQTSWLLALTARRFAVLALLTLLIVGIKVFEDVIAKESGPIDTALLWFIRQNTPPALNGFFGGVTLSGAGVFLVPATVLLTAVFLILGHRRAALILAGSMVCGWLLTWGLKALIDRNRPDLWSAAWYWGSSFPSGHTLSTAAFATSLALGFEQTWPRSRYTALPLAALWIGLVGLSRLVLGVHWPTDVLAAICLGVFVPLAMSLVIDLHQIRLARS
jgi:undecaprenyl-diphosphatase